MVTQRLKASAQPAKLLTGELVQPHAQAVLQTASTVMTQPHPVDVTLLDATMDLLKTAVLVMHVQ